MNSVELGLRERQKRGLTDSGRRVSDGQAFLSFCRSEMQVDPVTKVYSSESAAVESNRREEEEASRAEDWASRFELLMDRTRRRKEVGSFLLKERKLTLRDVDFLSSLQGQKVGPREERDRRCSKGARGNEGDASRGEHQRGFGGSWADVVGMEGNETRYPMMRIRRKAGEEEDGLEGKGGEGGGGKEGRAHLFHCAAFTTCFFR